MSNDPMNWQKSEEASIDPIQDEHFPSLFQSANKASLVAQRSYLWFQRFHLGFPILGSLVLVAITTSYVPVKWIYSVFAIFLILGIILTSVLRQRKYDKVWFDCRAIAESTKTSTWRFMMKAAPFKDDRIAIQSFIDQLQLIRQKRYFSSHDLAQRLDANTQSISDFMNNVRQKPLGKRQDLYLKSRLHDQKAWYSNKAMFNSKKEFCWFWIVLALQMVAITFAVIQASLGGLPVNPVPFLMTLAASAIAWNQMKRYGELAQTYSLAAQELEDQEAIALNITEEADFLALVEQVEETISREHTMWCARRNVEIRPNPITQ